MTSAISGHGKGSLFKNIVHCQKMKPFIDVLQNSNTSETEVREAGLKLRVRMYEGKVSDRLNKMRYNNYCSKAAMLMPQPEGLPPTERAASFHVLCVHLQAVRWKHLNAEELDALKWGWWLENGKLEPIMTDQKAAPDSILNLVRCKCKTDCPSNCSCRKHGLNCVAACTNCHGDDFSNASAVESNDTDKDEFNNEVDELEEDSQDFVKANEHQESFYDSDIDWIMEETVDNQ